MTRAEFVSRVAEQARISRAAAARAVDAVLGMGEGAPRPASRRPTAKAQRGKLEVEPDAVREIRNLAVRVWEDPADAEEFLATPHGLLDGETPLAAARTDQGAARVREILLALEYGLPV